MSKKPKARPIVFKSAPGAFAQTLLAAETLNKKFRGTNLDYAIRKAIEDGWLFVMPRGLAFAYSRGSGPISLEKVRLGHHEKQDKNSIDFSSPRVITATYSIILADCEEEENKRVTVDISIPSRFTNLYVERAELQPHNPAFTRLEFVYKNDDLRVWMREVQMDMYATAESECHTKIKRHKERIVDLRAMLHGKKPAAQSAFG